MSDRTYSLVTFNKWFSEEVVYRGYGVARFSHPLAIASGPTTVRFDVQGEASVEMEVEAFETEYVARFGHTEVFHPEGRRDNVFTPSFQPSNRCVGLEVNTEDGLFVSHGSITYGYHIYGDEVKQLSFDLQAGEFTSRAAEPVAFWVLPLINFTFPFVEQRPEIFSHPLRIWRPAPTPEKIAPDDVEKFRILARLRPLLIGFNFQNRTAFIEPLPDYEDIKNRLEQQQERRAITSLMVGYTLENPTAYDQVQEWFPFYLAPVLQLLAGREVGSPWIEWRDAEGQLVGRTHIRIRCPSFERGSPAFRTGSTQYAGLLLTEAQSSSYLGENWLGGVVRNLLRSASADLIEMRALFLFLALDNLCEQFDLSIQDLTRALDPTTRDDVHLTLREAAERIRSLSTSPPATERDRSLQKIADRTLNGSNRDRDFGLAVVDLFHRFNFEHDVTLAEANYARRQTGHRSWAAAISHWRGVALHGDHFDFEGGTYDFDLILATLFHLHDVTLRMVLSLLRYTGKYQPAVSLRPNPQSLDWVQGDTTVDQLGYAEGYRSL